MAVALVALFVALGGSAAALNGVNTVDSGDIINGQVKKPDLAAGSVSTNKLRPNAVTGANVLDGTLQNADLGDNSVTSFKIQDGSVASEDVLNDTLTGNDINESTLGQVPSANTAASANTANNANQVDGQSATTFSYNSDLKGSFGDYTTLFSFSGLTLEANCSTANGPTVLTVRASTDTDNSFIRGSPGGLDNSDFDISESPATVFSASASNGNGTIVYRRGNSTNVGTEVTSVTFAWIRGSSGKPCQFAGTVIGH
jgi:hypothetical protein